MPGACLVDVWDTLLRSDFERRFAALAATVGIEPEIWEAEWTKDRADRDRGKLTVADCFERTLRALGVAPRPAVLERLKGLDRDLMREQCRPFDDTYDFIAGMRVLGMRIALVSNCADTTRDLLDYTGLSTLVDSMILSCEVGYAKPAPEIYRTALDSLGASPAEAIFVDDQPSFCAGAQALGIQPFLLDRGGQHAAAPQRDFPVVRTLKGVRWMLL